MTVRKTCSAELLETIIDAELEAPELDAELELNEVEAGLPSGTIIQEIALSTWDKLKEEYGFAYCLPQSTGQSVSSKVGDDTWLETNIFAALRLANDLKVQNTLVDFFTLLHPNSFGNYDRFTDLDGLQVYGVNYIIDNYTGLAYYKGDVRINITWEDAIDEALSSNALGYNDWFIPTIHQWMSVAKAGDTRSSLDYPPFNFNSGSALSIMSSTTVFDELTYAYAISFRDNANYATTKILKGIGTVTYFYMKCRKHF